MFVNFVKKLYHLLSRLRKGINSGLRILLQITYTLLSIPLLVLLIGMTGFFGLLSSMTNSKPSATSATQKRPLKKGQLPQKEEDGLEKVIQSQTDKEGVLRCKSCNKEISGNVAIWNKYGISCFNCTKGDDDE